MPEESTNLEPDHWAITIKSTKLKKIGRNALKGIKPTPKIKVPAKKLPACL